MPIYHRLGEIPHKRHSVFRKSDGSLYVEELMGNKGFTGPSSLLYHLYQPTQIKSLRHVADLVWEPDPSPGTQLRHFKTAGLPPACSAILNRIPLHDTRKMRAGGIALMKLALVIPIERELLESHAHQPAFTARDILG